LAPAEEFFRALILPTVIALIVICFISRITLIILACLAFRALPPAVLVEIQWTSFLPHIS
jgi:hypothetical protein